MSAQQTHRKKVNHLQVGDIINMAQPAHGALVTRVERISYLETRLTFLVQPAGEDEVIEVTYEVEPDLEVEVS